MKPSTKLRLPKTPRTTLGWFARPMPAWGASSKTSYSSLCLRNVRESWEISVAGVLAALNINMVLGKANIDGTNQTNGEGSG